MIVLWYLYRTPKESLSVKKKYATAIIVTFKSCGHIKCPWMFYDTFPLYPQVPFECDRIISNVIILTLKSYRPIEAT